MKKTTKASLNLIHYFFTVVCIISVITFVTLAIYTNQGYKKGVAITSDEIPMFSSNLLEQITEVMLADETNIIKKDAYVTVNSDICTFDFNIYNYEPNVPTRINPNDIKYTLSVELMELPPGTDTSEFKVNDTYSFTANTCTISNRELLNSQLSTNQYSISFPSTAMQSGSLKFKIIATPDSATANVVNNIRLAAIVLPIITESGGTTVSGWSGHWVEALVDGLVPSDCTAFNYEISGNGSGTITLTWPPSLSIDPYYVQTIGGSTVGNSYTFSVDSATQAVYNIRFYRTTTAFSAPYSDSSFTNWPGIDSFIIAP